MADAAGKGWNAVAADSADPAQAVLFLMLPQAVALRGGCALTITSGVWVASARYQSSQ